MFQIPPLTVTADQHAAFLRLRAAEYLPVDSGGDWDDWYLPIQKGRDIEAILGVLTRTPLDVRADPPEATDPADEVVVESRLTNAMDYVRAVRRWNESMELAVAIWGSLPSEERIGLLPPGKTAPATSKLLASDGTAFIGGGVVG